MSKRIRIERRFVKQGESVELPDGAKIITAQISALRIDGELVYGNELVYEVRDQDDNAR
jgi:hypothetical protein